MKLDCNRPIGGTRFGRPVLRPLLAAAMIAGIVYRDGLGVPADQTTARKWFEQAKAKGYAKAADPLAALDKTAP